MKGYSIFSLARNALSRHRHWPRAWQSRDPRPGYDVVIVGGGGHGLATAYYLAREHGIRKVAVLEKGWIGGGNSGRNTQIVRSNYFWPESIAFYEHSLKLYEQLSRELNFNLMLSQRGLITLAHSTHEIELLRRWVNAIRAAGVDAEMLTPAEIKRLEPLVELNGRFPVLGGFIQRRAGIVRHDAVNWAFARAASALGADIIQECEVTGFRQVNGAIAGVETTRGTIHAERVCLAVAGHTTVLASRLGLRIPITSMALQAMVSEPLKPALRCAVMSPSVHAYVSQSDRGELVLGGGADVYSSYAQRGGIPTLQATTSALLEMFPSFSRVRLMRQWAGIVDITPDTSPIMGLTGIPGFFIDCGFGTGGFKAIPAGGQAMAHTIANNAPHPLIRAFGLERFAHGRLIDEGAAAGVAH